MSSIFPTSRTIEVIVDDKGYSTPDLLKLVKAAKGTSKKASAKKPDAPTPVATPVGGTHIHTLLVEVELVPPEEHIDGGYNRPMKVNPEYKPFATLRKELATKHDPLTPLDLLLPADRILGICPEPYSYSRFTRKLGVGIGVFLPPKDNDAVRTASESLLVLRQEGFRSGYTTGHLDLPGAKEWFLGSKAWDTATWLHAILSLDHREPAQRQGEYRDEVRRFGLETGLQIAWTPSEEEGNPDAEVTVKLILTVNVYLDSANLSSSPSDIATDLTGFILHSLIPSEASMDEDESSDSRNNALRHFFACMQPAPFLPRGMSSMDLQPKAMTSTLLPFQIRTLRLLLERERAEGYARTETGGPADPGGFWNSLDVEGERLAYRRMTGEIVKPPPSEQVGGRKGKGRAMDVDMEGELSDIYRGLSKEDRKLLPTLLDLSNVRGTMLCEEMGLGKTVEAIALLLHNRHPLSTSRAALLSIPKPSDTPEGSVKDEVDDEDDEPMEVEPLIAQKRIAPAKIVPKMDLFAGPPGLEDQEVKSWLTAELDAFKDARVWSHESVLEVTEVATTLIVCPPSLLKQWVSEIHAHAPGLRVCVYEGWQTIMGGVKKRQALQNKAGGTNANEKKRKATEDLRKKTVKKYAGRNGVTDLTQEEDLGSEGSGPGSSDPVSLLEVTQTEFEKYVRAHDVVITTYPDLAQDLAVAHPAPVRSRRNNVNYKHNERPRSPLIMVEWHRVIMDEVQLCSDQSAASEMVALIPRRNSLAVSGTPAKTDIKDLLGVLRFLRVPTFPYEPRLWHRLQQPSFLPAFEGLFRAISVRTTKRQVKNELVIPRQSRYVVPIDLSQIEQHYYLDTLSRQRDIISRRASGGLDRATLRACLLDLRQICTHIQVGMMQANMAPGGPREGRNGQRLNLGKELMTMKEALAKMKSDHSAEYLVEGRAQMRTMIRLGQHIVADKDDPHRLIKALANYERCRDASVKQLATVREGLKQFFPTAIINIDDEDEELPKTAAERRGMSQQDRERAGAITSAKTAIRELLLIQHQAWFLMGDVKHQTGETELETEAYGKAEDIRKEILASSLRQSVAAIARLDKEVQDGEIRHIDDLQTDESCGSGGIASADAITSANELLTLMNENALLIWEWRKKIIELLHAPVEADPEEPVVAPDADGEADNVEQDFYAKSLKSQGELQMYLTAYAAALSDRKEMMSEERNLLADVDAQRTTARTTTRAKQAREAGEELGLYEEDDLKRLLQELMEERQSFMDARKGVCERPLKAYLLVLNAVVHNQSFRKEEIAIAKEGANTIRQYVKAQTACYENLIKELDNFRGVFNHRVKFFAALQEISDSVAEVEEAGGKKKKTLREDIESCTAEILAKETRLAHLTVRGRFLEFLGGKQDKDDDELREDCIICMGSSDDTHGLLLDCGHFFCASCFKAYRTSRMKGCPSCRREINDKGITRFKLAGADTMSDQKEMQAQVAADVAAATGITDADEDGQAQSLRELEEQEFGRTRAEEVEKQARDEDLERISMLDLQTRREIAHMDMMGEYGSKIDFLIKHLMYYRARQPEVRHVIFSNWSDSLSIVTRALRQNGITYAAFEGNQKSKDVVDNFIKDPSITVFLLHAERESAGLTLTTCQVVHLLEPVLRHSFELQAIGRVDRLGQTKETTVYCYATRDTVESRILALGVRNGTSIYLKADDAGRSEMESKTDNVVSAASKGGDLGVGDGNEEELLSLIL